MLGGDAGDIPHDIESDETSHRDSHGEQSGRFISFT